MKRKIPRETAPGWVWLALALMVIGKIIYVAGYLMIEEMAAHIKT
jgi:hypothetical protein